MHTRSRRGSALVMAMLLIVVLTSTAGLLTELTVSRTLEQQRRSEAVTLLASSESSVNSAYDWLANTDPGNTFLAGLTPMADGDDPQTWTFTPLPAGTILPSINGQTLSVSVVKLRDDDFAGAKQWGDEVFLMRGSAMQGQPSEPMRCRRREIDMLLKTQRVTFFNQAMYAIEGFTFGGSANTDSWDSRVKVLLSRDSVGTAGNRALQVTGTAVTVIGMAGGTATARATGGLALPAPVNPTDGDTVTLDDGTHAAVVFEFDSNAASTAGRIRVTIDADPTTTMANLATAINTAAGLDITATATNGAYTAATSADGQGDLGSNGTIQVDKPENVHGTAYSDLDLGVRPIDYVVPSGAEELGALTISSNQTLTVSGGRRIMHASSLTLGNNKTWTIAGGTAAQPAIAEIWCDGAIDFKHGNLVFANPYTSLWIYQNDYPNSKGVDFPINGNASIGSSGGAPSLPQQFVYITNLSGEMRFNGNAAMSGVLYAPNAHIRANGSFDFYGSVISKSLDYKVNGNFSFHYDVALGGLTFNTKPVLQVIGWKTRALGAPTP